MGARKSKQNVVLADEELEEQFDQFLNHSYGQIEIANHTYEASFALKRIDPIAYRLSFDAYLDSLEKDGTILREQ